MIWAAIESVFAFFLPRESPSPASIPEASMEVYRSSWNATGRAVVAESQTPNRSTSTDIRLSLPSAWTGSPMTNPTIDSSATSLRKNTASAA